MPRNRMAEIHDWLWHGEAQDQQAVSPGDKRRMEELDELERRGVTPILARLILRERGADDNWPLSKGELQRKAAEVALADLIGFADVDPNDKQEMRLARKQARYARKLYINYRYLERNLRRNLARLDARRSGRRRRRRRPHSCLGTLTPTQRRLAEELWDTGANHELTLHQAMYAKFRDNPAVYMRCHRILKRVLGEC